jgi:predicted DNA-binding ribbon-helix-helix protein
MNDLVEVDRVQTGIRLERRLVKVLKATAQLYDLSLGDFLEKVIHSTFAGRQPQEFREPCRQGPSPRDERSNSAARVRLLSSGLARRQTGRSNPLNRPAFQRRSN